MSDIIPGCRERTNFIKIKSKKTCDSLFIARYYVSTVNTTESCLVVVYQKCRNHEDHDLICIWVYKGEGRCYTLQFLLKFCAIYLFIHFTLPIVKQVA